MGSSKPRAIIDIGSNSVRLVVYSGARRIPVPIFNEKVLVGLGKGVSKNGAISPQGWDAAIAMLSRFKVLLRDMRIKDAKVVATAAVRDASNGADFASTIRRLGLDCRVISPAEEARLAGEGVLSAFPDADGIVGDLGGGSLELVEVGNHRTRAGISLPLGVLRINGSGAEAAAARSIQAALAESDLAERGRGRTLYLVGGSWRTLARVDMALTGFPLPIANGYSIDPSRLAELRKAIADTEGRWASNISPPRLASLPAAAMLLSVLARELRPRAIIVSAFGIREGLLYSGLNAAERRRDPLIEAARDAGSAERRFGDHGDILDAWIAPLFDDPPEMARIRRAACLLADVSWQADSVFRADRAVEMALHGNWVAITAAERVMMAQALSCAFGRDKLPFAKATQLASENSLRRAGDWGLAMRLGQRLSAGVGSVLEKVAVSFSAGKVQLHLRESDQALLAGPVLRRLERLANALGGRADVVPS